MSTNKARYANFLANLLLKGQVKPSASHHQRPTLQLESRCALAAGGSIIPTPSHPQTEVKQHIQILLLQGQRPLYRWEQDDA